MTSLVHVLNTGTLAAWLSVVGFGTVGVLCPEWGLPIATKSAEERVTEFVPPEIQLGAGSPEASEPSVKPADPSVAADPALEAPEIPPMPEIAVAAPLPEIPEMPVAVDSSATGEMPPASKPANSPRSGVKLSGRVKQPKGGGGPSSASGGGAVGAGMSDGERLAAGHMPSPVYPAAARSAGQTGTVVVAFTVDGSGRVIAAHALKPSPWPLLNEEAVRTVRRWKFPPGGIMKLQRPIVFQLR